MVCFSSSRFFSDRVFFVAFSSFSRKKIKRKRRDSSTLSLFLFTLSLLTSHSLLLFSSPLFREMPPRTRRGAGAADESDGEKQVRFSVSVLIRGLSVLASDDCSLFLVVVPGSLGSTFPFSLLRFSSTEKHEKGSSRGRER